MKKIDLLLTSSLALSLGVVALTNGNQNQPQLPVASLDAVTQPKPVLQPSPSPSPTITPTPTQPPLQPVVVAPVQPTAQPVYQLQQAQYQNENDYQPQNDVVAENPEPQHRGSGRVNQQGAKSYLESNDPYRSMQQQGESTIDFVARSASDPVWAFGDDNTWYPSAYGLPDQTTDDGDYRCFLTCRIYYWHPAPGSKPINKPDPTRNARRIKGIARFFGAPFDEGKGSDYN